MKILYEDSRNDLIAQGKRGEKEKGDGKSRFEKRVKSKFSTSVREYNAIDMNSVFFDGILTINIPVKGETANYLVRIKFGGFMEELQQETKRLGRVDLRTITRALINAFNRDDVYIHCSCLSGDTKIKLLDGTSPTIRELVDRYDSGEELYVYSVDDRGDFCPGKVLRAWQTGIRNEMIRVTLDNGEVIECTPEHLFMLRDGTYIPADALRSGVSLMPLYFSSSNGYETVKYNSTGKYHSVYKVVAEKLKQTEIEEASLRAKLDSTNMRYDVAIHHKDFNKSNNHPDNLEVMTANEHWMYHANLNGSYTLTEEGRKVLSDLMRARNANPTQRMIEVRNSNLEKGKQRNYDLDRRLQQSEIMRSTMQKYYSSWTVEDYQKRAELYSKLGVGDKISTGQKRNWEENPERRKKASLRISGNNNPACNPEVRAKISRARKGSCGSNTGMKMYTNGKDCIYLAPDDIIPEGFVIGGIPKSDETKMKMKASVTKEVVLKRHRSLWLRHASKLLSEGITINEDVWNSTRLHSEARYTVYFDSFDKFINFLGLNDNFNHKVVSVERILLPSPEPVYDLKIDKYENFLLDAGVIVHNCPDFQYRFSYWTTVHDINSGAPESRPARITNPHDNKGPGCKHIMLVLSNTSWIIKVSSVINNYIKYMEMNRKNDYAKYIYPALYGEEYKEPVQLSMDDSQTGKLDTETDTIDTANEYGRTSGRFKPGNPYRFQRNPDRPIKGQMTLDDVEDEENNDEEEE